MDVHDGFVINISMNIEREFDQIETNHDELRQMINEQKQNPNTHSIINEIDQWEIDSIDKIKQTANQCREKFLDYNKSFLQGFENKLNSLAQEMKGMRQENEFNDLDLHRLKEKLNRLERALVQPTNVFIEQHRTSFLNCISLRTPSDIRWKQVATTIVGRNSYGNWSDQLQRPTGICFNNQNETGGNGEGNGLDQLNRPVDVMIDKQDDSLIIADAFNRRVMKYFRQVDPYGEILISDIGCSRLAMDKDGSLYVSDRIRNEVRRWKRGELQGTTVAGGNGQGNELNQLYSPTSIFITDEYTLYVADRDNHRIMKWMKDAKEGTIVVGGNGPEEAANQLDCPSSLLFDNEENLYVVDIGNDRIQRFDRNFHEE